MKAADLPMSEDQLLANVIDAAKKLKLRTAHFRPAQIRPGKWVTPVQGDGAGWPDLVIVGPGGSLLRELKSATGSLSAEQKEWLGWLTAAGLDAAVWKPRDWRSGRILSELQAIARPKPHCDVVRDGETLPCPNGPGEPHVDGDGREYVTVALNGEEASGGR